MKGEVGSGQRQAFFADRPWWLVYAVVLLVGVTLRLWRIGDQVVGGDEVYGLEAALEKSLLEILITYQKTDNCIPLTAIYRVMLRAGLPLSEIFLRLPSIAAGVGALLLLPLWLRRELGRGSSLIFAWMLATSPLCVFYSRMARPYAIGMLLAMLAIYCFCRFYRRGTFGWALGYAVMAILTGFFHLGFAPMVCAPVVLAFVLGITSKRGPGVARSTGLALLVVAGYLAFLVPARKSLIVLIREKRVDVTLDGDTARGSLHMLMGSGSLPLSLILVGALLFGLWLLLRRRSVTLNWLLVASACQVVGLALLSPFGMERAHVFTRYFFPLLPVLLICLSLALHRFVEAVAGGSRYFRALLAVSILALWLGSGPFWGLAWWQSNFTQSVSWLFYWQEVEEVPLPDVYSAIDGGPIIEAPWNYVYRFSYYTELYQRQHGMRVLVLPTKPLWSRPDVAMKNNLALTPEALLGSPARWLVLHEEPFRESELPTAALPWRGIRKGALAERERRNRRMMLDTEKRRMSEALTSWGGILGPPDHRGDGLSLWNLDRVRAERGAYD